MRVWPILHVDRPLHGSRTDRFLDEAWDLADRFGGVYVVDRAGQERNKPSIAAYQTLARGTELWLDTGPVHIEDIMDVVIAGADRVTLRWDRIRGRDTLFDAMEMVEDGLFVGIPFDDEPATNRRSGAIEPTVIARRLHDLDAGGIVLIDQGRAGSRSSFRTGHVVSPTKVDVPVWAAGGVKDTREVRKLLDRGYGGVLVGTARDDIDAEAFR